MNPLKVMAMSVAVLAFGYVQAQDRPLGTQPASPAASAESMGGVPAATGDAGAPTGKSRAQVYEEFVRARQSGELGRIDRQYNGQ